MSYIIPKAEIKHEKTYLFQGGQYNDVPLSFFWLSTPPGLGVSLHLHPYIETFVLQKGRVTFTIGDDTLPVDGEMIVVVPANTPHKFINSGEEPLQMLAIHANKEVVTYWLED